MKRFSIPMILKVAAAIGALQLAACNPSPEENTAAAPASGLTEQTQRRVDDLVAINAALQQYHATHNAYPVSNGMQGYASAYGSSLGANWIPELGQALPRDPANSDAGDEAQYLYSSDGTEYKLVAHASGDCSTAVEVNGIHVDPRRTGPDNCWAYGFWSPGGERL